ncbi:endo-1,3-1,4-beta glucanase-related protein [Adhaeribacter aerolatus]|uniref:Endo-1,3-1,4-beta glucanase-related protein n=1 Tax=Adhaeribacter aerolatus TaxID=670289 RepID=A0A512AV09_9BACT|nr:DUF1080 domain-containing protein [Adhaeribacter aerolatus]GEO03552.1 endo-1,3-1,4-beta glucanase-related protein [Adhaeribacter aerolatus]
MVYSSNLKLATAALIAGLFSLGQAYAQNQPGAVPKPPKMVPEMTEFWEPEVKTITPGTGTAAPSDAVILFDGKDLSQWKGKDGGAAKWQVKDGAMIVTKGTGAITTKQNFEDFQLHVEWSAPTEVVGNSQGRGNSGIFLQDRYEVQVLDNYNNRTYANGQAGSIYKQTPPLVNAMRKPGEWNTYDILYTAPRFKENGTLIMPARVTIIHNGVVVQNNTEIKGATEYIGLPSYKAHGKAPIQLQDHGNPVRFRNIWLREL